MIESLLKRCSLKEDHQDQIVTRLIELENTENEFEMLEIECMIDELYQNQHDPIVMGMYYNQTDIKNHLKKLR